MDTPATTTADLPLNATSPLPPMGASSVEDQLLIWQYLARLARESREASADWVTQADQSRVIFQYGDYPAPPDERLVINDIKNQVINNVDVQTRERATGSIEPSETGDPPTYWWSGPPEVALALGVPAECILTPGSDAPPQPMPPDLGEQLAAAADGGQPVTVNVPDPGGAVAPQAITVKERWVVAIDDASTADFFQTVYDKHWELACLDQTLDSFVYWLNIDGYVGWLYEFDPAPAPGKVPLPRLRKLSVSTLYLDPMFEEVREANNTGFDVVLDMSEGEAQYPDLAPFIRANARTGEPQRVDANTQFGQAADRNFQRPVVTLRIYYLRNQPIPLTVDEALTGQHVTGQAVAIKPEAPADEQAETSIPGGMGGDGDEPDGRLAEPVDDRPSGAAVPLDGAGETSPVAAVATRIAYLLPDGTETAPPGEDGRPGDGWPTRRGIRQVIAIGGDVEGRIVEDRECPHWEFPIVHGRNIPVPGKPYGEGEPIRLLKLQRANSGLATSMVNCARNFASPLQVLPKSVADKHKQDYGIAYAEPGTVLIIEDDVLMQLNGKIDFIIPPPQLPAALVQLQPLLGQWIDRLSGYNDASRGILPSPGASGKTVELLQQGSNAMASFKAKGLRYAVWWLSRLMLHNEVHHMTVDELCLLVRKYAPHIVAEFQRRGQTMDFDVKVEVAAHGMARQQKQQEARENRAAGLISLETAHDALGIDHKTERRRMQAEAEEQAQIQAEAQANAMAARAGAAAQPQQGAAG